MTEPPHSSVTELPMIHESVRKIDSTGCCIEERTITIKAHTIEEATKARDHVRGQP